MPGLSDNEIYRGLFKSALRRYFYNNKDVRQSFAYMSDEDYNKFVNYNEDMGAGTPEGAKQLNEYNKIVFGSAFTRFYNRAVGNMMSPDGVPYKDENELAKSFVEGKPIVFLGTGSDDLVSLSGDKDRLWSQFLNINSKMSTQASLPYIQSNDNVLATSWNVNDMKGQREYDRERDSVKPTGGGWWNSICKFFTGKPSKRWENYERHLAREKTESQIKLMHLPKDGSGLAEDTYELSEKNKKAAANYAKEKWAERVKNSAKSNDVPKDEKLKEYKDIQKNTDFLLNKKNAVNNELSQFDKNTEPKAPQNPQQNAPQNPNQNVPQQNAPQNMNNPLQSNANPNPQQNVIEDDDYDDPDDEIEIVGAKKVAGNKSNELGNKKNDPVPDDDDDEIVFKPKKSQKQLEQEKLRADKDRRNRVFNENNNNLNLLKKGGKVMINNKQKTIFADKRLMTMTSCNNAAALLNIRKTVEGSEPINPDAFGKSLAENMSRIYLGQTLYDNKDSMSSNQYSQFSENEYEFNELNEYEQWVRASNGSYKKDKGLSERLTNQMKESAIYKTIMSSVQKNDFTKAREDMDKIFFDENAPFNQKMNSVLKEQGKYDEFIQNVKGPNYKPVEPEISVDKVPEEKTSNLSI